MSADTLTRAFTLDDVLDFLTELDTEPEVPCDWGCAAPAKWQVKYVPCNHFHNVCERHKRYVEQRQLVADGAPPPFNYYATYHKCCGAKIWRATWRSL
jgi:hypothetical protein